MVPAAGFAGACRQNVPKQYLSIGDKTILQARRGALLAHSRVKRVVIAISPGDAFCSAPAGKSPQITVVDGGAETG